MANLQHALGLPSRRDALRLFAASGLTGLSGCCAMRPFASPGIVGEPPLLGTPLMPTVRKSSAAPELCIDVHAHFFNGTDVPVKGYLAGPIAHDMKEPLRSLLRTLAPLSDALVALAPTASDEYLDLLKRFDGQGFVSNAQGIHPLTKAVLLAEREKLSEDFYRIVKNSDFEKAYNTIKRSQDADAKLFLADHETSLLNPASLLQAVNAGGRSGNSKALSLMQKRRVDAQPYADGVLAFVAHMLSPRWHNLVNYAEAYSSGPEAFGFDHTLGALVDFDLWLDCPPRSAHEDQIRLHQLLSTLSGSYMKPLVGYNPWTDIRTGGEALARVRDAVKNRGYAGVKIYPPNGFYPYGNVVRTGSPSIGPSFAELDRVLEKLWELTLELDVPVMAHTNDSSGKDTDFDLLGGPAGWRALLARFNGKGAPRINLGHFGGDNGGSDNKNKWSKEFAELMAGANGEHMYGDLAFWSGLRCRDTGAPSCGTAKNRLASALQDPVVGKRVMFGTDWFMLSVEREWAQYPFEIAQAIQGLPLEKADFFGLNAQRCFPAAQLGTPGRKGLG